jgi:hypothetical protein
LAENERCVIYKDWRRTITPQQADVLAKEYQTNIYPKITPLFGEPLEGYGKLVILLLDIIDGFSADANSYMVGYFDHSDMDSKKTYQWSNEAEILYMDTVEGRLNSPAFNATLAHELQHLLRYSEYLRRAAQTGYEKNAPAETWLDEGLSIAAEYVYLGYHADIPVWYYNEDPYHKILGGDNFYVWTNDLVDYYTAYLFFQWLRIQATGDVAIYKEICESPYLDASAVVNVAAKLINPSLTSWEKVLRAWLLANYMNTPRKNNTPYGLYGYNSEYPLRNLKIHPLSDGSVVRSLLPGEGVYSVLPPTGFTSPPAGGGPHIGYAGVKKTEIPNPSSNTYTGDYLLTYNGNPDRTGGIETGWVTGISASASPSRNAVPATGSPTGIDGTSFLQDRR